MPSDQPPFRLRDVALTAYGPTIVNSIGHGAVLPVLALQARDLGADVSTAALVVALVGLGSLATALPVGALIARIGERRALVLSGLLDAAAMVAAALATSWPALAVAVTVSGMAWTTFLVARQGYLIDVVPQPYRARAMSGLGGSHRIGLLVGPLLGAGLIHLTDLRAVFVLAAVASLASAALARLMPDLGGEERARAKETGHLSVLGVVRRHRRVLATVGVAVVVISASRALRTALLPLWAEHVGMSASTTSLVFAVAAAVDVAFFLPGGWLMDTRGRTAVAVPVVGAVAVACFLLPLATETWSVTAVMVLIAIGNGLGSGIVMTLGADTAPTAGRSQFLGAWRLCGDLGVSGGPLLVGAAAALLPLAGVSLALGALMAAGTVWVGYWTSRVDARLSRPGR
ncbi:MFS transporter [Nocardioides campestrisoli]|uniref:MFS transporter n=1 Tax=Nocardioides campestrisoli TaxID=2736757 RepID=UPI0015E65564|nr:MFS transporter [Nocardioides campestrisoli]